MGKCLFLALSTTEYSNKWTALAQKTWIFSPKKNKLVIHSFVLIVFNSEENKLKRG